MYRVCFFQPIMTLILFLKYSLSLDFKIKKDMNWSKLGRPSDLIVFTEKPKDSNAIVSTRASIKQIGLSAEILSSNPQASGEKNI